MNHINLSDGELAVLAARIQKNYEYDDRSGRLVNKRTGKVVKGKKRRRSQQYRSLGFRHQGKVKFLNYHWAVWAWHNGRFPSMQLDHINGVETDNRIENLREVSGSENNLNMLLAWKPNIVTGVPGVSPIGRQYRTKIHGSLYYFSDPNEAFFYATMCGKRYAES
jgi:hypothetical protein